MPLPQAVSIKPVAVKADRVRARRRKELSITYWNRGVRTSVKDVSNRIAKATPSR